MLTRRRLGFFHQALPVLGVAAVLAGLVAMYVMTQSSPKRGTKRKSRIPVLEQSAGGSLDYWIGTWDAKVADERKVPDLTEAEREALTWSRAVLGKALGEWITTPKTRRENVESPLRLFVPSENQRASRFGEAWTDTAGNEWRPTDGQRKDEFWIQTRVRFRGRELLLGMAFVDVPSDVNAFEFHYMVSLDNGAKWLTAVSATYTRAGAVAEH